MNFHFALPMSAPAEIVMWIGLPALACSRSHRSRACTAMKDPRMQVQTESHEFEQVLDPNG